MESAACVLSGTPTSNDVTRSCSIRSSALKFAFSAHSVSRQHVDAALSAYLLAGVFFGNLYWVLEQIQPGSFTFAGESSINSAIYFSFVTLATLGYGDIVPRTDVARGLAIVEAVGGQLFLAVMIARLVSLYAPGKRTTSRIDTIQKR
jgi:Ion channel